MAGRRRILLGGGVVLLAVVIVAGIAFGTTTTEGPHRAEPRSSVVSVAPAPTDAGSAAASGAGTGSGAGSGSGSDGTGSDGTARAGGSDSSAGSWWRRVPPVGGVLTAPDGEEIGRVTVLVTDGDELTVTVFGDGPLPAAAERAVLTSVRGRGADLGAVSPEVRVVVYVVDAADADLLPDPVRALELRSADGTVVASAVLLPF